MVNWMRLNYCLICELQHVELVGLYIRWLPVWVAVVACTLASTAPRWDGSTCWRRVLAGIAWFIAAASPAPCAKNIVSFKTVDLTWILVWASNFFFFSINEVYTKLCDWWEILRYSKGIFLAFIYTLFAILINIDYFYFLNYQYLLMW